jgi:hypothetical protein
MKRGKIKLELRLKVLWAYILFSILWSTFSFWICIRENELPWSILLVVIGLIPLLWKMLIAPNIKEPEYNIKGEVVDVSFEQQIFEAQKESANTDMLFGALWCIGGIIVTVGTYSAASNGGFYVIAWGAIVFGAIKFIKGLINLNKR